MHAPHSWATMLATACAKPQLPESRRDTVTTGLRWHPDTWPIENAITMMPMPNASAVTIPKLHEGAGGAGGVAAGGHARRGAAVWPAPKKLLA